MAPYTRKNFLLLLALGLLCALLFPGLPAIADDDEAVETAEDEYRSVKARKWAWIKRILPYYLWEANPIRRKKMGVDKGWEDKKCGKVKLSKAQYSELAAILRDGSPYKTEKNRNKKLEIPTGEGDEKMPVKTCITGQYRPKTAKSFPLIITCHGGPQGELSGAETASGTQYGYWASYAETVKGIVAAPALTGTGYGKREWTFISNLIDELDKLYNVDRDRILLTGHSWGGIITWWIGPPHADTFAVLAPFVCATNPRENHLKNLRALPVYHVQGERDHDWMLRDGRARNEILNKLEYEHVYVEKPGGHEGYPDEINKIAKYFGDRRRRIYADKLVRTATQAGRNNSDYWYWVKSADHGFTASIDRKKNTIDVAITGPFEVFLSDEMVNLDKPVVITRNGKEVWKGTVERRLDFTLNHVKETNDRGRVFAASVVIE